MTLKIVEDMLESMKKGKVTSTAVKIVDDETMTLFSVSMRNMSEREIHEYQRKSR